MNAIAKTFLVKDTEGNRSRGLKAGTQVTEYTDHDYGMKRDEESLTGKAHINVTPDGLLPFFCIPLEDVQPV